ncbi:FRG domain-containing protein [Thermomonas fusca]|uniref:FRG domain-containing protein n=1 Tax=Thermomonas fusca TaxID=215690 RepID=UPI001486CCD8|nr:FRG domain-containing protein [Thermomonas fusca]
MKFNDVQINSVAELITTLKTHAAETSGEARWFRGQENSTWQLTPSISRNEGDPLKREYENLKRFRQMAPRFIDLQPRDEWEWLFLMQHYAVKTRLLDWTESPLVALYFAVLKGAEDNSDAALWVILPAALNKLTGWEELQSKAGIPFFGMDKQLEAYLTSNVVNTPAGSGSGPIAAVAPRTSARIAAQLGVFTVFHADFSPLELIGDESHIWRYVIPSASKQRIREELAVLQMNEFALFPELDKLGGMVSAGGVA